MKRPPEWQSLTAAAEACIERWDARGARQAAERARSQAAVWGDKVGVSISDLQLARVALIGSPEPAQIHVTAPAEASDAALGAALLRFEAERAAALAAPGERIALPALAADAAPDLLAAVALRLIERLERPERDNVKLRLASELVAASDPGTGHADRLGYLGLLRAWHAESSGHNGLDPCESVLRQATEQGQRELAFTALRLRAVLCERRELTTEQAATLARQRALLEEWAATLPAADAVGALRRPDRARLLAKPSEPRAPGVQARLIEVSLALAQEREQQALVDLALDAALALTGADRGLLLLKDPDQQYRVSATRYGSARASSSDLLGLSSTIAERVFREGQAVVSSDVRSDNRFTECASIALEITSVLCVPIHARAELEGAIYLDRTTLGMPFTAGAIEAATAVASMLGAALLNGRIIRDLEERTRQLELAREELSVALATRTVERDDITRRLADIQDVVPSGTAGIIGRCAAMQELVRKLERVAASDTPVLVAGETGVGKELVARAVHQLSSRRDKPFVAVNCGALSENLLEAELFGAERGAYTGANSARPGLFVAADGGTLFLDEVGDMPPAMQKALLRVLETSEVRPVGSTKTRQVNVRIVSASHRDLLALASSGAFRDDLRYRLEVVRLDVPPLRERLEDMPELCEHLLHDAQRRYNLPARRLSAAAFQALCRRRWQGNVRELRHVLAGAALAAAEEQIGERDLPAERASEQASQAPPVSLLPVSSGIPDGHELRAQAIRNALKATLGHKGKAADMLGISRSSLYRYMEQYGIDSRESG